MVPALLVIDIFVCSLLSSLLHYRLTTQQQFAAVNYQGMRLISFLYANKTNSHSHGTFALPTFLEPMSSFCTIIRCLTFV